MSPTQFRVVAIDENISCPGSIGMAYLIWLVGIDRSLFAVLAPRSNICVQFGHQVHDTHLHTQDIQGLCEDAMNTTGRMLENFPSIEI